MSMTGVLRLGEVCIRVLDIHEAREHYGDRMGLIESHRDGDDRSYYKAWDEHDEYSIVLAQSDTPGMDYFAFKVLDDATLTDLDEKLRARGLDVQVLEAGVHRNSGRRVQFTLPSGHTMQLFAEKLQVGNGMSTRNPGVLPDEGYIRGMRINRLDHCLLGGVNLDDTIAIFQEVFGFGMSEKLVDADNEAVTLACFLSCTTSPHDIAFVMQPEANKFHHASFLLDNVHDVYHAGDLIGKHEIPVDVGPTRHGITRGATIYFFDPSGNRNEVFTEGYIYYPDNPVLVWDTTKIGQAIFSQDNMVRESFLNVLT
ncbi:MAG: catechol 2,3-dioxygenase [Acidimicrobiia bacterium]